MATFVSAARADGPSPRVLHGFLGGPRPVFGSYHVPAAPVRDTAWVICPPLGWEGIQSYQTVQLVAAALASAGMPALRLHYDGSGESPGSDDDDGRVAAWLESVRRAIGAMSDVPGVTRVGLVGVRIGATLAGTVAGDTEVAALVFVEPCASGAHYTREMEILASASPSAVQRAKEGVATSGVEAGGYLLTPKTIAELGALDLAKTPPRGKPDVLLLCRDDRPPALARPLAARLEREGLRATLEQLPGYKGLMTYPEKAVPGTAFVARIRDWALERSSPIAAPPPPLRLAEDALVGRVRHRPIRFGPAQRLFGVLTEPAERGAARPMLFLTGGVVPRTGVNRMYVEIATRLAGRGHTVLRMDVSGICESPPADGVPPNDPHAPTLLADVRDAVALLRAETGAETVSLMGLCSGAYATFQTALADANVVGATLLNPEVFHLKDGTTKFSETEQSLAGKHYRQSLTSLAAWKKLLSGKANVRYIAGFVGARARSAVARGRERLAARVRRVPPGVAGDLHRLLGRGVKVAIVMAEGDPGYEPLLAHLGGDREALERMGLRLKIVPGPDHTFNDFSTRRPLVDWLVDRLAET